MKCSPKWMIILVVPLLVDVSGCKKPAGGSQNQDKDKDRPIRPETVAGGSPTVLSGRTGRGRGGMHRGAMKPEELFGLEKDLRKQLESDPEAAFKEIKRLHYPPYDRADKKMKWHMDNMARAVGESNGLPISERLDYMFYLLPEKQTPFVVDDMIRNLDRKELQEVSVWFGNIGPGEAKTEICLRIVERMERLGIERAKILEWIDRLETKDAKARAILMLDS